MHSSVDTVDLISAPGTLFRNGSNACLAATVVGFLSHVLYFIRGSRTMQALGILAFYLAVGTLLVLGCLTLYGAVSGLFVAAAICASYLGSLFGSIVIYRLFFHRLRHVPGPFVAKFTKLYGPWAARKGKYHIAILEMLDKYGDIVRTGKSPVWI